MAQPTKTSPSADAPNAKATNSTPATTNSNSSAPARPSLFSFLTPSRPTAGATNGSTPARPGFNKFFFGMIVLLIGLYAVQYGLLLANTAFHLNLLQTMAPPHANVPILSGLSYYAFISTILLIALYVALIRFKILPTNLGQRAAANRNATTSTSSASAKPIERPAGSGADRTRAARRIAERAAERAAAERAAKAATAKGSRGPLGLSNPFAVARKDTAPTTATTTQTTTTSASGAYDAEYQRARAAQRQQRRRATRR